MSLEHPTRSCASLLAALLCGLVSLISACNQQQARGPTTQQKPAPVTVTQVERRTVPRTIKAIGAVESPHSVRIMPQVDGAIAAVHFSEGQRVEEGQLLFTIDRRPFEALLRQRQAALRRDQAELTNARAEARRRAALFEQGLISAEENEAAQTRVATLEAAVEADRAAVADAQLQLEYCSIRSPVAGRASQVFVHAGNVVRKQETVLTVVQQMSPVRVAFQIREQDLAEVRSSALRQPVQVWADAANDANVRAQGILDFIDNTVQRSTGTVLLKASFPNTGEELWPGQFVPLELIVSQVAGALVIPRAAVQVGQQGTYVFRIEGTDRVRVAPLQVVFEYGDDVVVEGELEAGQWVVTEGQFRLTDGAAVEIRARTPGSAQAGAGQDGS